MGSDYSMSTFLLNRPVKITIEMINTIWCLFVTILVLVSVIEKSVNGAQINYLRVPFAVRHNINQSVILDCDYMVRPDDQELIIKWYLNDEAIYQWIPPQRPQALGQMQDRLDLSHRASTDPNTVYRAMKILNPTIDIAGDYKCFVSSLLDEDFHSKSMVVYEPESSLKIVKREHADDHVNFTCEAAGVCPQPKIVMYEGKRDDYFKKNPLEALEWNVTILQNGTYSVSLTATAQTYNLEAGSLIQCELHIPGTGYLTRKSFVYYPLSMDTPWNGSCPNNIFFSTITIFQLFICLHYVIC